MNGAGTSGGRADNAAVGSSVLRASWILATALLRQLSVRIGDQLARDLSGSSTR